MTHRLPPFPCRPLIVALAAGLPVLAWAAPPSNSAYRTDGQSTHVEDATSRGINTVNMITCILSALRPDALVNEPTYRALVDESKCNNEERSSSSNSAGAEGAVSYTNVLVNASRTSNDTPMRVKGWLEENNEGQSSDIFINVSATSAPTSTNPYGVFRMDFCGKPAGQACFMQGFLEGATDGIRFYEQESGGGHSESKALRLINNGADSGSGQLNYAENGNPVTFTFAYNATFFRRSNGTSDECFSRDASDTDSASSVWRYGLYDATSGDVVTRQSGFPLEFASGGQTWHGYMGYWGLNMQPGAPTPTNGDTVQRVQYGGGNSAPTKTPYTVVQADGRLLKYTRHTRTLASIDKIRFTTWVNDATGFYSGATNQTQYELYWDDAAGSFKVTGFMNCGGGGCTNQSLPSEQAVAASYFAPMGGARGWSQALGGEVFVALQGVSGPVDSSAINVVYRSQDLVYPADMPASLHCISNCPTQASLASYFTNGSSDTSPFTSDSAFRWSPTATLTNYTLSTTTGLLSDGASQSVTYTDGNAMQQRPQYANGVRSGRLFTDASAALCDGSSTTYCEYKIESLDTYYVWETGSRSWNQFAALKDNTGAYVQFDAPLNVAYNVPSGASYGDYAGKTLMLQYGGYGDLWGIPGQCVSRLTNQPVSCDNPGARYVPAFSIPFDETLGRVAAGATPYLVKWLDREIRFARKPLSECTNAGLNLPTGLTLPTAAGLVDPSDSTTAIYIGDKPTVTDAPRVIHGEVKY